MGLHLNVRIFLFPLHVAFFFSCFFFFSREKKYLPHVHRFRLAGTESTLSLDRKKGGMTTLRYTPKCADYPLKPIKRSPVPLLPLPDSMLASSPFDVYFPLS